jgi:hypothetical protein
MGFKTQEDFFKVGKSIDQRPDMHHPPATITNNFLGTRPMTQGGKLAGSGFKGNLFDDPEHNLHGDLEQLTKEDFKERLIVAEKVMKSLF